MKRMNLFFFLVSLLAAGVNPGFLFAQTLNLDYSTYLGGSVTANGHGISVGTDGRIYVTGYTESSDFPTENPYQAGYGGGGDVFVSALSSTGAALSYSTFLGGVARDYGKWNQPGGGREGLCHRGYPIYHLPHTKPLPGGPRRRL
jgi:hypothetical protein